MAIIRKRQPPCYKNFISTIGNHLILLLLINLPFYTKGQILNADQFGSQVDSTRHFKGLFEIGANIQKQNTILVALNTKLDLAYWHRQSLYTIVGQFNLFRSGSRNLINGGYAHARMRLQQENWIHPEFFAQYQANGVRGMENRILLGGNIRFRLIKDKNSKLFAGVGYMYEYERWDFSGVSDISGLTNTTPFDNHYTKTNLYVSYAQKLKEVAYFQLIGYFQTRPDRFITSPRLAFQGLLRFQISKHISFTIKYDIFYDALPPVPIDQVFFSFNNKITFTW